MGAFERFELAPETKALISDRLSALIVSDQDLSDETGKYIDFIVQVRLPAPQVGVRLLATIGAADC